MPTTPIAIRPLSLSSPLHWLRLAWEDLEEVPWLGLSHGCVVAFFAQTLLVLGHDRFWFLAGAFSGFLLVAPVLAVGLYAVSRALETGQRPGLGLIWRTWLSWRGTPRHDWRLVRFGLLLGLAGTGWVVTSAALITLLSAEPIERPMDMLIHVVAAPSGLLFELWLGLGAVLAAPVFASSVITLPLLLDRNIGLLDAVLVSWRVVLEHPLIMGVWAALIVALSLLALATAALGFILLVPLLGHATWHAYRQAVDVSSLPPRPGS